MILIDSSGWIEYFRAGPLKDPFAKEIENPQKKILSVIQIYEIYKVVKRDISEEAALQAIAALQNHEIMPLDASLAAEAADWSLQHHLAMADAIIYATAQRSKCKLITMDSDFSHLPNTKIISSK